MGILRNLLWTRAFDEGLIGFPVSLAAVSESVPKRAVRTHGVSAPGVRAGPEISRGDGRRTNTRGTQRHLGEILFHRNEQKSEHFQLALVFEIRLADYPANDIFLLSAISVKPVYPVSHNSCFSLPGPAKISQGRLPGRPSFSSRLPGNDFPAQQ